VKIFCFKCGHVSDELGKVSFRATCPKCDSDLHVCKTCRFYSPGKPNDCAVPGTDYVPNREASNLCEEFSPNPHPPNLSQSKAALDKARRLLGED